MPGPACVGLHLSGAKLMSCDGPKEALILPSILETARRELAELGAITAGLRETLAPSIAAQVHMETLDNVTQHLFALAALLSALAPRGTSGFTHGPNPAAPGATAGHAAAPAFAAPAFAAPAFAAPAVAALDHAGIETLGNRRPAADPHDSPFAPNAGKREPPGNG